MQQPIDIDPIVSKYLREETLSAEEEVALKQWISQGEGRSQMLDDLKNEPNSTKTDLAHMEDIPHARIWEMLVTRVQQDGYWQEKTSAIPVLETAPTPHRHWWRYLAAASVLVIITSGAWFAFQHKTTPHVAVTPPPAPADIAPGTNRATLTLADGRRIDLNSSANGVVASQGNTNVTKLSDGQLAYNKASEATTQNAVYNILSTPRAGQFSLALPDGTKVWLNNASSIRYPVAFTGNAREVELTGEAYFEVAKDATHPFLVHTAQGPAGTSTIEVLGTSFNLMAYNDESAERATLIDGSIRSIHGDNSALLRPEEQSVLEADGKFKTLHHVNTSEITAWKNGYFHFDHSDLHTTMRQLARWYDVSVDYQGDIPQQEFIGKIQRSMTLSSVLKGLEGEHIHFKLEGRKLIVTP